MCGIALVAAGAESPAVDTLIDRLRSLLARRGPDACHIRKQASAITAIAGLLHLRGTSPGVQPACDAEGNVLLWNGQVFGGMYVPPDESDTTCVLRALCAAANGSGAAVDDTAAACEGASSSSVTGSGVGCGSGSSGVGGTGATAAASASASSATSVSTGTALSEGGGEAAFGATAGGTDGATDGATAAVEEQRTEGIDTSAVVAAMDRIEGPWAMIYIHARSSTIWFGRDRGGRRSLLVGMKGKGTKGDEGTDPDTCFVVTSVGAPFVGTVKTDTAGDGAAVGTVGDDGVVGGVSKDEAVDGAADGASGDACVLDSVNDVARVEGKAEDRGEADASIGSEIEYLEVPPHGLYMFKADAPLPSLVASQSSQSPHADEDRPDRRNRLDRLDRLDNPNDASTPTTSAEARTSVGVLQTASGGSVEQKKRSENGHGNGSGNVDDGNGDGSARSHGSRRVAVSDDIDQRSTLDVSAVRGLHLYPWSRCRPYSWARRPRDSGIIGKGTRTGTTGSVDMEVVEGRSEGAGRNAGQGVQECVQGTAYGGESKADAMDTAATDEDMTAANDGDMRDGDGMDRRNILRNTGITSPQPTPADSPALHGNAQRLLDCLSDAVRIRVHPSTTVATSPSSPSSSSLSSASYSPSPPALRYSPALPQQPTSTSQDHSQDHVDASAADAANANAAGTSANPNADPIARRANVGVLFSGGVDSTVLAALAHYHVPAGDEIELINVCFDGAHRSPDRIAAMQSAIELALLHPDRKWRLVLVDIPFATVEKDAGKVLDLVAPRRTHMDFNIGARYVQGRGPGGAAAIIQGFTCVASCSPRVRGCMQMRLND